MPHPSQNPLNTPFSTSTPHPPNLVMGESVLSSGPVFVGSDEGTILFSTL